MYYFLILKIIFRYVLKVSCCYVCIISVNQNKMVKRGNFIVNVINYIIFW